MPIKLEKQEVKCPACNEPKIVIFDKENPEHAICKKCGVDVEAVYRHAYYKQLAAKVAKENEEPPTPPKKQKKEDPFSFNM
jgi:transcription elongation factor Elf1